MENENQNQNNMFQQQQSPVDGVDTSVQSEYQSPNTENITLQAQIVARQHKTKRNILLSAVLAIVIVGLGYFGYKNPQLFRAAIISGSTPSNVQNLYIPNYNASSGDEGNIAIKAQEAIDNVYGISFTITSEPKNALIFNANSVVADGTSFQSALIKNIAINEEEGKATVTVASIDPVSIAADGEVIKLAVRIDPSIANNINLNISNVEVSIEDNGPKISDSINTITAGTITIDSANKLKALNAEAIDRTHVRVDFSDLLQNIGTTEDYNIVPSLEVKNVEHGSDQKSVILTADPQVSGDRYIININADPSTSKVIGNTTGRINTDYSDVLFYGYGQRDTSLDDFTIKSAEAIDEDIIDVTFSEKFIEESIHPASFSVYQVDDDAAPFATVTNVININNITNTVQFKINNSFVNEKIYYVSVDDPNGSTAPRSINNDILVVNKVPFAGFGTACSPVLSSARVVSLDEIEVNFIDNIDISTLSASDLIIDGAELIEEPTRIGNAYDQFLLTIDPQNTDLSTEGLHKINVVSNVRFFGSSYPTCSNDVIFFAGYQESSTQSNVEVEKIETLSDTSIRLVFSEELNKDTFTSVNVAIESLAPTATLTISEIKASDDNRTFEITTVKQVPDINYFITFNGVKDSLGRLLENASVLNFLGYSVPTVVVSDITPNEIINDSDKSIVIFGQNLNQIKTVRVGSVEAQITEQSNEGTSLHILVPADLDPDVYDFILINVAGEVFAKSQALVVKAPERPMQVISEESRATPYRVPNDGETKVNFWVLIEDPQGLANIESVSINLEQIGGQRAQEMAKDNGPQPQNRQWYTFETTIPSIVATKDEPYELPVTVRKGTEVQNGTVSVVVTRNVLGSVAPTIDQVYVSPTAVPPDGETKVKISAKVTDPDGADTITSVMADLGVLGIGFVPLVPIDTAETATELTTRFYASEEFTVPNTTQKGSYTISITASDDTGENSTAELTFEVSSALTAPTIKEAYIAPWVTIQRENKTKLAHDDSSTFSIHVSVHDPNGLGDIASVIADFGALSINPISLERDSNFSDDSKVGWFIVKDLTIPATAPVGYHHIGVTVTDKSGTSVEIKLKIEVTHKDVIGDTPRIVEDRAYATPRVAINDGKTPIALHVFVTDEDDDIESVVMNLSTVGQIGPEQSDDFIETDTSTASNNNSDNSACSSSSKTLVCMNPSVREGVDGQWFVLPDVTISTSTTSSTEPYYIEIIATDKTGSIGRGKLPIYVNNGQRFTNDKQPPEIILAVATSSTTIEVLFNEEIAATSISGDGHEFTITDRNDINKKLEITAATINANGTIVTLTTIPQQEKEYALSGSGQITDAVGVPLVAGASNRVPLSGFIFNDNPPSVEYIASTGTDTIEIEFADYLKPSTLRLSPVTSDPERLRPRRRGGHDFNIEIYASAGKSNPLDVLGVSFVEAANILEVKTASQEPGQRYRVNIKDIASYSGKTPTVSRNYMVKGFKARQVQQRNLTNQADLNGDGRVDFIDFTMFSAVYGMNFMNNGSTNSASANGPYPLPDNPDATVPTNSEPAGGSIVDDEPSSTSSIPAQ